LYLFQELWRGFASALALGVFAAAQEEAATAGAELHRRAAVGAGFAHVHLRNRFLRRRRRQLVLELFLHFRSQWLGAAALGIGAASLERPARARLDHQGAAAFLAHLAGRNGLDGIALGVHVD